MPAVKLAKLEQMNAGSRRGRMGSGDHTSGAPAINRTSINGTYIDTLDRVLFAITKTWDA